MTGRAASRRGCGTTLPRKMILRTPKALCTLSILCVAVPAQPGSTRRENAHVRVTGVLKNFSSKRYINANNIRRVTDFHEIPFHMNEVMYVMAVHQRGPVSLPSDQRVPSPNLFPRRDCGQLARKAQRSGDEWCADLEWRWPHATLRVQLGRTQRRRVRSVRAPSRAGTQDCGVHHRAAAQGGRRARRADRAKRAVRRSQNQVRLSLYSRNCERDADEPCDSAVRLWIISWTRATSSARSTSRTSTYRREGGGHPGLLVSFALTYVSHVSSISPKASRHPTALPSSSE